LIPGRRSVARKKKSTDVNVTAFEILQAATGQSKPTKPEKNPAAVALGRLGGLKGGFGVWKNWQDY
jgi:LPS O-antigen subunit length determinant protein (WzzB/FepE family)